MGEVDERQAIAATHAAIDSCVTFIDTAEGYRTSEEVLGRALEGRRDDVFLATKLSGDHSVEHIRNALTNSLKALRTDYVDLYQIHGPKPEWPIEDTMAELVRFRDEGKVRYLGVSNFSAEQTEAASAHGLIHSSQPRYNMLFRDAEATALPACERHGIGVIAHSVLAKGLLAGKYRPGHEFDEDDQRHDWEDYHGEKFARTYAVAHGLDAWARDHGRDLAQLALAWPVAHPAVTSSIVGIRTPEQARLNARAGDWTLTPSDLEEIDEIQGGLRLHFYHGPDREYYGFRDEGDPEYAGLTEAAPD
jgi:aryl-alcohol dehydrogenase-like predicted oxidoreductase